MKARPYSSFLSRAPNFPLDASPYSSPRLAKRLWPQAHLHALGRLTPLNKTKTTAGAPIDYLHLALAIHIFITNTARYLLVSLAASSHSLPRIGAVRHFSILIAQPSIVLVFRFVAPFETSFSLVERAASTSYYLLLRAQEERYSLPMMPSNRRLKAFFLLFALLVLLTLYITASGRQTRSSQFYTKTSDALTAARAAKEAKLHDTEVALGEDDSVTHRLRAAEEEAKRNADKKGDEFHGEETKQKALKVKESLEQEADEEPPKKKSSAEKSLSQSKSKPKSSNGGKKNLEEGEKSVAGRIIIKEPKEAVLKADVDEISDEDEEERGPHEETDDEQKAHAELNDILKKSPSTCTNYCQYARR